MSILSQEKIDIPDIILQNHKYSYKKNSEIVFAELNEKINNYFKLNSILARYSLLIE